MTMSCCVCEPTEKAQSVGDDTHAVVAPKWAPEHVLRTGVRSVWSVGWTKAKVRPRPLMTTTRRDDVKQTQVKKNTQHTCTDTTAHETSVE